MQDSIETPSRPRLVVICGTPSDIHYAHVLLAKDNQQADVLVTIEEFSSFRDELKSAQLAMSQLILVAKDDMGALLREVTNQLAALPPTKFEPESYRLQLPRLTVNQGYVGHEPFYVPMANPPKQSKKSRRGHNKAQDRVFGKAGYC
jgi:hypothetical protein